MEVYTEMADWGHRIAQNGHERGGDGPVCLKRDQPQMSVPEGASTSWYQTPLRFSLSG